MPGTRAPRSHRPPSAIPYSTDPNPHVYPFPAAPPAEHGSFAPPRPYGSFDPPPAPHKPSRPALALATNVDVDLKATARPGAKNPFTLTTHQYIPLTPIYTPVFNENGGMPLPPLGAYGYGLPLPNPNWTPHAYDPAHPYPYPSPQPTPGHMMQGAFFPAPAPAAAATPVRDQQSAPNPSLPTTFDEYFADMVEAARTNPQQPPPPDVGSTSAFDDFFANLDRAATSTDDFFFGVDAIANSEPIVSQHGVPTYDPYFSVGNLNPLATAGLTYEDLFSGAGKPLATSTPPLSMQGGGLMHHKEVEEADNEADIYAELSADDVALFEKHAEQFAADKVFSGAIPLEEREQKGKQVCVASAYMGGGDCPIPSTTSGRGMKRKMDEGFLDDSHSHYAQKYKSKPAAPGSRSSSWSVVKRQMDEGFVDYEEYGDYDAYATAEHGAAPDWLSVLSSSPPLS